MFTLDDPVTEEVYLVQSSVVKLHEATQMFMMVSCGRKMIVKKSGLQIC